VEGIVAQKQFAENMILKKIKHHRAKAVIYIIIFAHLLCRQIGKLMNAAFCIKKVAVFLQLCFNDWKAITVLMWLPSIFLWNNYRCRSPPSKFFGKVKLDGEKINA